MNSSPSNFDDLLNSDNEIILEKYVPRILRLFEGSSHLHLDDYFFRNIEYFHKLVGQVCPFISTSDYFEKYHEENILINISATDSSKVEAR